MSDLLIKGVGLPKKNEVLWLAVASDGTVEEGYGQIPKTKAIEIPPHGRLIDADKLIQYLLTIKPRNETIGTCVKCEIKDLEDAPTVLEATE